MRAIIDNESFYNDLPNSSPRKYSTEETVIGAWYDGRPLYSQVIVKQTGDLPVVASGGTVSTIATIPGIQLVNASGYVYQIDNDASTQEYLIPYATAGGAYYTIRQNYASEKILIDYVPAFRATTNKIGACIIIEYVKDEDL